MDERFERFYGKHGLAASLWIQIGVLAMLIDGAAMRDAGETMSMLFAYFIGSLLVCFGLNMRLTEKGYAAGWSLLGFLSLIGWAVVSALPERREGPRGFPVEPGPPHDEVLP